MPATATPSARAPPWTAPSNNTRPVDRSSPAADDVARAVTQPLTVFELPQLVRDRDRHVGVRADAERSAGAEITRCRKNAVAEVGFRDRAQTRHGAARRETRRFIVVQVRRMYEAPA